MGVDSDSVNTIAASNDPRIAQQVSFYKKSLVEHSHQCLCMYWRRFAATALAVLGCLWMIVELGSYFLGWHLEGLTLLGLLLGASLAASILATVSAYRQHCPVRFENESAKARKIAHLQPARWEAGLVKEMLLSRLPTIRSRYNALEKNEIFVGLSTPIVDIQQYVIWSQARFDDIKAILRVYKNIVFGKLMPSVLAGDRPASADSIKESVDAVIELYSRIVDFEYSAVAVRPPEILKRAHELQLGWTSPIRDAIEELVDLMQAIEGIDLRSSDPVLRYNFVIESLPRMDEFNAEMDRLASQFLT